LKTSPEETELKLYLLLFLAPDWSNNCHRRLFVQSAFNHFESDVEENLKLANTRLKKRTSLFKMILSQLKEEQRARHSHFYVGPAHQHRLQSFRT